MNSAAFVSGGQANMFLDSGDGVHASRRGQMSLWTMSTHQSTSGLHEILSARLSIDRSNLMGQEFFPRSRCAISNSVEIRQGRLCMTNPFEDENGSFYALVNEQGQYSLWPAFAAIPKGWIAVHGAGSRADCLKFIEQQWTDLRPKTLHPRV